MIECEALATTGGDSSSVSDITTKSKDVESQNDNVDSTTVTPPKQADPPPPSTKTSHPTPDDIVILDDDDVENVPPKAGHSIQEPISSSALFVEAECSEKQMETEKVIKETKLMMQNLTRKELEEIVINRTIETINSYSNMGCLRNKFLQLHATKDKLFQKSTSLQKQVNELTKAVRQLTENLNRNPKSGAKPNQPLRFFRSVGLQVGIELSAGKPQPIPKNLPRLEPLKTNEVNIVSSNKQIRPLHNNSVNGIVSIGQKRSFTNPTVTKGSNHQSNTIILSRPNTVNHHSPAILNGGKNNLNNNNNENIENRPKNGIEVAQKITQGQPGQIVYGSNGELQVRLLNQSGVQFLSGLQFVTNPGGGAPTNNQTIRLPIQVAQSTAIRSQAPGQIALRQNTIGFRQPVHLVSQQLRPTRPAIRPPYTNKPGQQPQQPQQIAIQQRTQAFQAQNRFILPPLPPPHLSGQSQAMMARRGNKECPPRPTLELKEENDGIVLSWNLIVGPNNAEINTYQLYACQESLGQGNKNFPVAQWKRVGDVKALPLPMACTLSQFTDENRYYFIVRALDVYNRAGLFCEAKSIVLTKNKRR